MSFLQSRSICCGSLHLEAFLDALIKDAALQETPANQAVLPAVGSALDAPDPDSAAAGVFELELKFVVRMQHCGTTAL